MSDEAAQKAWVEYEQWRRDEGGYGRRGDKPSFMAGRASVHDSFESMRSRIAALEATISAAIAEATDRDSAADMLSILELAPSVVLDQMIREAKAEARKEALIEAVRAVEANRLAFVRTAPERAFEQALDASVRDIAYLGEVTD